MTCLNPDGSVSVMKTGRIDVFYVLNGAAARYWLAVDGKTSCEEISSRVREEFGIRGRSDGAVFRSFEASLLRNGLVVPVGR